MRSDLVRRDSVIARTIGGPLDEKLSSAAETGLEVQ